MAWEFNIQQFSNAVDGRVDDIPAADRQFVAVLLGIDPQQTPMWHDGDLISVNKLCELANLEGVDPRIFFRQV